MLLPTKVAFWNVSRVWRTLATVSPSQAPVCLIEPDTHLSVSSGLMQMIADMPRQWKYFHLFFLLSYHFGMSKSQCILPALLEENGLVG